MKQPRRLCWRECSRSLGIPRWDIRCNDTSHGWQSEMPRAFFMKVLRLRGDTWDDFAGLGLNFHTTSTHVFRHWQDAWRVEVW